MIRKRTTFYSLITLFLFLMLLNLNNSNIFNDSDFNKSLSDKLNPFSSSVNGRSLSVIQHANVSNSFFPSSLPTNISFTLAQGWISENIMINYDGVAFENDTITNGEFETGRSGWPFQSSSSDFVDNGHLSGIGNPAGCMEIEIKKESFIAGDYGYYEQTRLNVDNLDPNYLATASMSYFYDRKGEAAQSGISVFLEVEIGAIKANKTVEFIDLEYDQWSIMYLTYDPSAIGQYLPNDITVRAGVYKDTDGTPENQYLRIDNIEYKIWNSINEADLLVVYDNDYNKNYTYANITEGKGTTFIDVERNRSITDDVIFMISKNNSYSGEFSVKDITISSECIKLLNSTYGGLNGSFYTTGGINTWNTEFSFFIPFGYEDNWAEIEKPNDWIITSFLDGYNSEKIGSCSGIGLGSETLIIPKGTLASGLWKLEAVSQNYIESGVLGVWNGTSFNEHSLFTIGDLFHINITLNDTIPLIDTQLNCTIEYPNGTIFWHGNKEPSSPHVLFGNFTVGKNMSVGVYRIIAEWTNNISSTSREKVGYYEFTFSVWHHTNLTAVNSYFEMVSGDPLLLRVRFVDFDMNSSIDFATITYSSTFGSFGSMIYLGSGVYFIDLDTSSLSLGDYYFSFNASKFFYENQTIANLIHLKIVEQPIKLEVPHYTLEGNANSIISCKINSTGAITGTPIFPVNISTDWFNPYNITDHNNGTYTLDFSTLNIPTSGHLESYNIEIFANKSNYGITNEFITLLVYPISAVADVNTSLVSIDSNEIVNLKVNYTIDGSSELILNSNCTVTWQGSSQITPVADGFNIKLFTNDLPVDYYSVLIKLEKVGYEFAFESVTIIINEQDVNLTVSVNSDEISENSLIDSYFQQTVNISVRAYAVIDEKFLTGGMITLMSNNFQKNLTETSPTYFNSSLILDGANFSTGINNIFLRFEQTNYTIKIFPFQLFIRAQNVNLSTQINYQDIHEGYLVDGSFNQNFHISCRAFVDIEGVFLSGGNVTFINGDYEVELYKNVDYWFNQTVLISTSTFSIGPNYVYIRFLQNNYSTTIFAFQVFVNQLEIEVNTLDFDGLISGAQGESILIRLNLTEIDSSNIVENATIFYSWVFGAGYATYIGSGIYELDLQLPTGFEDNYIFELVISKEGVIYKTKEFSFIIDIYQVEEPNPFIWIIISALIIVSGLLSILSLRNYVILPRKRRKESELLSITQPFKDAWNIQTVILIHKESGLPMYSEELTIMEDEDGSTLLSGFVQAITAFSEKFIEREFRDYEKLDTDVEYMKKTIDLDFKFFQLIVCDYEFIRVLLVLRDLSSERLKKQLFLLTGTLDSKFNKEFKNFSGTLDPENKEGIHTLLKQFLHLYYNRPFELTPNKKHLISILESGDLTKLERRLINVISSMVKFEKTFTLKAAIHIIEEKNEDLVIEALNSLILRNIIKSSDI